MFSQSIQKESSDQAWKSKQTEYKKESNHKSKQNSLQSLRYLNFSEVVNWRIKLESFKCKIESVYNYYTILNTLFAISQEVDWRSYIGHMNVLISTFHNIMCSKKGSNIQDISKINNFQTKFSNLFLLKDLNLHKHLMLLLKLFLAFNGKYAFLEESLFSETLVDSAAYFDAETINQVLWILAQIEISSHALVKLLRIETLVLIIEKNHFLLLPLLTVIANFLSNPNQSEAIVQQLVNSGTFQKIFQMGISSYQKETINETLLIFNNSLCFSKPVRNILLKEQKILRMIMELDCPQKQHFRQIISALQFSEKVFTGR